jgi:hypothetical protein
MNVTSLEVSKELFELSGWKDTSHHDVSGWINAKTPVYGYSLGYLLRKLPPIVDDNFITLGALDSNYRWVSCYQEVPNENIDPPATYMQFSETPEDAAAKLAIELFKQGILTR